jgi:hypothetical protein
LSTNSILHGRQEVDNQIQDPNDELQDTGTSPTAPGDTMASKERPMHDNDVPRINQASSLRNEHLIQGTDGRGPAHCVVLPSGIDELTRKEMHLFRPWKTLTRSMQLLSAYKRLPPSDASIPTTAVVQITGKCASKIGVYPAFHASNARCSRSFSKCSSLRYYTK